MECRHALSKACMYGGTLCVSCIILRLIVSLGQLHIHLGWALRCALLICPVHVAGVRASLKLAVCSVSSVMLYQRRIWSHLLRMYAGAVRRRPNLARSSCPVVGQNPPAGVSRQSSAIPVTKSGVFPAFLAGKQEKRMATPRADLHRHSATSVGFGVFLLECCSCS